MTRFLTSLLLVSAFANGQKLEVLFPDTNYILSIAINDTLKPNSDYLFGDTIYRIKVKYLNDTVVVFFDKQKQDTMIFAYYSSHRKEEYYKEWYPSGKVKEIIDVENSMNKGWHENGNLRFNKVGRDL